MGLGVRPAIVVLAVCAVLARPATAEGLNAAAAVHTEESIPSDDAVMAWMSADLSRARAMLARVETGRNVSKEPFDAVLGNPVGDVLVTVYTDRGGDADRLTFAVAAALESEDPGIRIEVKELPWSSNRSVALAKAMIAARRQGRPASRRFELRVASVPPSDAADSLAEAARAAGLDVPRFERDFADPSVVEHLKATRGEADGLGVEGTPTWFVGGRRMEGVQGLKELAGAVRAVRKERSDMSSPP